MPTSGKILLLSCCAPCACAVIKKLHEDGADFAVAFYNPNIHPAAEYAKRIENEFNNAFSANLNLNCIDVCQKNVTKANGIKELLKIYPQWQPTKILTIGDAQNDIPMIEEFNGFSLNSATVYAKQHAAKLYDSVGDMLLENL